MYEYKAYKTVTRPLYMMGEEIFNWNGDEWRVEDWVFYENTGRLEISETLMIKSVSGAKSLMVDRDTEVYVSRPVSTHVENLEVGDLFVSNEDLATGDFMFPHVWVMLLDGKIRNLLSGEAYVTSPLMEVYKVKSV